MEPLSVTASVISVLQLTNKVIQYLSDVKDAPKECQQCVIEASNLLGLLTGLRYCAERAQAGDPWFEQLRNLNAVDGPLDQYQQALKLLQTSVEIGDGVQKIKKQLSWKDNKEIVRGILARIERLKSLVSVALEMDHRKLSEAIKDDTTFIRANFPPLQASAAAIEAGIDTLHSETRSVKDDTISIRGALIPLQASATTIKDAQSLQHHQMVMEWLSPTDFSAQQHNIISRRQVGTGQWFLDSVEFRDWLQGQKKTLFCPGIPGAGKTMMAAIAIDHLHQTSSTLNIGLACIFCSYKAQTSQNVSNMFAALLKQLVHGRPDITAPVNRMYNDHSKLRSRPLLDEILQVLQSISTEYSTTYIIADALDEISDRDNERTRLIDKLLEFQRKSSVQLLFTSRPLPTITQKFTSTAKLEVRANADDVSRFVAGQMPRLPLCIQNNESLKCTVQRKIVETADGMFLLARLHVDSLLDKRNKRVVLSTLDRLSKGSEALDEAYGEAMKRIDGQLADDRLLARRALLWISFAQRLLTTRELCLALAIEPGSKALDHDNVYEIEDILSVCAGLVTVDEESSVIRLVHHTTQEYIERIRMKWHHSAQEDIAVACLTYLCFDRFATGSCPDDDSFEKRLRENELFDYVVNYWSDHIRPTESSVSRLALTFLSNEALVDSAIQAFERPQSQFEGCSRDFPSRTSGLHLAARFGLLSLTNELLACNYGKRNVEADLKDSHCRTPLSYAAQGGHELLVLLLARREDVEIDSKDDNGRTPLSWAAWRGHDTTVKLLLDEGADPDSRARALPPGWKRLQAQAASFYFVDYNTLTPTWHDPRLYLSKDDGETPLSYAANNGYEAVVKLLLDNGAAVSGKSGAIALQAASVGGQEQMVKLFLEKGADINAQGRVYGNALQAASKGGHEQIAKLLLEKGADVNAQGGEYGNALQAASIGGHEQIAKLLLDHGSNINAQGGVYNTALQAASVIGQEQMVKLLLDNGAYIHAQGGEFGNALQAASVGGHKQIVKLLLDHGFNISFQGRGYYNALHAASACGHESVVRLLIDRDDVEADLRDNDGRTPLWWAATKGHNAVVRLLVERVDVEADSKDNNGQTPLYSAATNGNKAAVKLLLDKEDVEADSKDKDGRTPLWGASMNGHESVVKLLLEHKEVKADSKDNKYRQTPLCAAAIFGHEGVVKILMERDDVDPNLKDIDDRTPLWWAAMGGHEALVQLLVKKDNIEVNLKDRYGRTPLCCAAENVQGAVIKILTERDDVEADSRDNDGQTPLSSAAMNRDEAVIKLLMGRVDVEPDSKDIGGRTPLWWAAVNGNEAVVKLLIERGDVNVDSKSKFGRTPLWWAARNGHAAVVKLLLNTGKVKADSKDVYGHTPLWQAMGNDGYEPVIRLLRTFTTM